jgi:hypothetical protein
MITKIFFLIVLACEAKRLTECINLEIPIENPQENCIPDSIANNYETQKNFLESQELLEEHSFINYWYSYGPELQQFSTKATNLNFIKEILRKEEAKKIFDVMKRNYKRYMRDYLFREFLGLQSKEDKEKLLFQAISLYQGRFRSVWVRLGKPGPKKFNYWPRVFSFFQRTIDLGIHDSIEAVFHEIMNNIGPVMNEGKTFILKKQFCMLIKFLSTCESEKYGLHWIADHPDPGLILAFFLYPDYPPSKDFYFFRLIKNRKADQSIFEIGIGPFQRKLHFEIQRFGKEKVKFDSDFRNPYSSQINDEDLISIVSKIITRLLNFCPQKVLQVL